MRADMVSDANALAHHGLIDRKPLEQLRGTQGYADVAFDLLTVVSVFRAVWPQIEGKTVVTREKLVEAAVLADRLLVAAGLKSESGRDIAEVALRRDQAFTLLVNTYDEVRRAVVFVRWHEGDADDYAPSLYAGRFQRRSKSEEDETPAGTAPTGTPTTGVPTTGTPTTGVPATGAPATGTATAPVTAAGNGAAPGTGAAPSPAAQRAGDPYLT